MGIKSFGKGAARLIAQLLSVPPRVAEFVSLASLGVKSRSFYRKIVRFVSILGKQNMRFSVAQLIVFVTIAAFLIAFGDFLLGMLERSSIPISVFGFLVFLNGSRMFSGKNVLLTLAISLPALLV